MARAIKASIVDPDRTTKVYYIKNKSLLGHNAFRLPKTDEIYIINPDYAVYTVTKRLGVPFRYVTYYYKRNIPVCVDWPNISGDKKLLVTNQEKDKKGNIVGESIREVGIKDNEIIKIGEQPIKVPAFNGATWNNITSKELGQLLNPEFLKMISRAARDKKQDLQFYLQVGTAAGVAFLIYYVMQNLPKAIAALLHKTGA